MPITLSPGVASLFSPPAKESSPVPARRRTTARSERRRTPRYPIDLTTACVLISLVDPLLFSVRIRDISLKGLGLVVTTRVPLGVFLAIKLQGSRMKKPRVVRARVIHATYQPKARGWLIGCYLVDELRPEELDLLL